METGDIVRRGFTLIELIIVIALMAIAGTLVVANADALLRGLGSEAPEHTLQRAVQEARFLAASERDTTRLRYDEENGRLEIFSEDGASLAAFPVAPDQGQIPTILFEQILPAEGLQASREETAPLPSVVFRPDRSSTPFRVVIGSGNNRFSQRYDPFSAIVIEDSRQR